MHVGRLTALLVGSLVAAPAAPASITPPDSAIVVEGSREREQQIRQFIKTLMPAPVRGQTSRFETAVCPAVVGLPQHQNGYIEQRMRRIADAAGIPVAGTGCTANAIVIVTNDKNAFLRRLEKERPEYFPVTWEGRQIHSLQNASPVAAWQLEEMLRSDGTSVSQQITHSSVSLAELVAASQKSFEPDSRLKPAVRKRFVSSILVVQADALAGLTTMQLADYAAMRTLVRTDPDQTRDTVPNTILNVIEAPMGTPVPITLTAWDMSFLKAFYASGKNNYVESQRSQMQRQMRQNLDMAQP